MTATPQVPTEQDDDRRSSRALDLETYIPAMLTYLAIKYSGGAAAIYRARFGISITEWRIMSLLAIEPWMVSGRITEIYGFDKATVSRSMSTLQAKQLAETRFQANNNRRQYIALTAEGLRMHDEIVQIAQARERQLVSELTDEERTTLVRLLTRMSAQIPNLSDEADK
jgi:DNA-binding MarR family transcriptional regulator